MHASSFRTVALRLAAAGMLVTALWGVAFTPASATGTITEFTIPTNGSNPFGIAAGPDGNVWFTENGAGKIGRITPTGSIVEFTLANAFSFPEFIAAGPDGNLWFTESGGNNVARITPAGTISEFPVPTLGSHPGGIVAGSDGNLWFTEGNADKIGRITPSGAITEFPLPPGGEPLSIAAGSDGNLWFTDPARNIIWQITPTGSLTFFPGGSNPLGITSGPDGNLWFTDQSGIGQLTPAGAFTQFPLPADFGPAQYIVAGSDGNLWFTDIPDRVGQITTTGSITEFLIPTSNDFPQGIAAGRDGSLWFTEFNGNKIGRLQITTKQDQSISFAPLADKILGEPPFGVIATASSGLSVAFTATGPCSVSGSTVSLSGTGPCTITAAQAGNNSFNAAPNVSQTFKVLSPAQFARRVIDAIAGMSLPSGLSESLTSKLAAYVDSTARGDRTASCGQLGAFVDHVNAQSGKQIPPADAELLLIDAARLTTASACR